MAPDTPLRESRVAVAGGRIVGSRQAVFGSFAIPEDLNFATVVRASDVWFVVDGRSIAGCAEW